MFLLATPLVHPTMHLPDSKQELNSKSQKNNQDQEKKGKKHNAACSLHSWKFWLKVVKLQYWYKTWSASGLCFLQPGALGVIDALTERISALEDVDLVFHVGDISYATGFMVEWDSFLEMINPVASRIPYMTAIGNHERCALYVSISGTQVFLSSANVNNVFTEIELRHVFPSSMKDHIWAFFL